MPVPYYVSPEQLMQDKAEYAKKGIAKGRSIVVLEFDQGVLFVADNPSSSLNKISEIYDNIAFAGAGKYSEFENLRKAGIRHADLKGYMYSREDVTAKSLANAYSQSLGTIFSQEVKPLEVEILVVAISEGDGASEIYRIDFDGSISDEKGFTVIGGKAEEIKSDLKSKVSSDLTIKKAFNLALESLESIDQQKLNIQGIEVALLDRKRSGRKFRRLSTEEIKKFSKEK
ncbi:MAG: proteasome subunit alpha [Nitrospirae bacterium]|nr:proteasome subunit alpha [Nitrospirota bacterium]MBI3593819.1 proteasome subunit alpha [Nitrospirota bacterium]